MYFTATRLFQLVCRASWIIHLGEQQSYWFNSTPNFCHIHMCQCTYMENTFLPFISHTRCGNWPVFLTWKSWILVLPIWFILCYFFWFKESLDLMQIPFDKYSNPLFSDHNFHICRFHAWVRKFFLLLFYVLSPCFCLCNAMMIASSASHTLRFKNKFKSLIISNH